MMLFVSYPGAGLRSPCGFFDLSRSDGDKITKKIQQISSCDHEVDVVPQYTSFTGLLKEIKELCLNAAAF